MIYYRNAVRASGVDARLLKRTAQTLLAAVDEPDASLSLSLVGDRQMRAVNREHRGTDRPTDVLSFPLDPSGRESPERLLGDIVISVETARRQAEQYDAPLQDEIHRLLIHGLLHVLGHDHEEAAERAGMEAQERRLAGVIGMPWPYDE
jgi:probable rRNA maturation factor